MAKNSANRTANARLKRLDNFLGCFAVSTIVAKNTIQSH